MPRQEFCIFHLFFCFSIIFNVGIIVFFFYIYFISYGGRGIIIFQSIGYKNTSLVFSLSPELHFCFVLYQYCNHKVETKLVQYQHIGWALVGPVLTGWAIGWADGSNIIVIFCGVCKQQFFFLSFLFFLKYYIGILLLFYFHFFFTVSSYSDLILILAAVALAYFCFSSLTFIHFSFSFLVF